MWCTSGRNGEILTVRTNLKTITGIAVLVIVLSGLALLAPRPSSLAAQDDDDRRRRLEILRSVPYTSVTEEKANPENSGVIVHKPDKAYRGYNIYCSRISPEVLLIDMTGDVVHRWSYPEANEMHWDHTVMLPDGDIVVIVKFNQLLRLDWHSNLVWQKRIQAHHDVAVAAESTLYVIERAVESYRGLRVRFPAIVHLTSDGEEIERWSTYDHLSDIRKSFDQGSFLDTILDSMLAEGAWFEVRESVADMPAGGRTEDGELKYDYFHLNTITVLPETPLGVKDRRFRAGNLLTCFRNVNQIAVLDKDKWDILWVWGEGILDWPHHPTMVRDGKILVFDNGYKRRYSRLIELDPRTNTIEWTYVDNPPRRFFTGTKGSSQRLPNGNTLICQGNRGRAFEVTREGEIVWEWLNPMLKDGRRVQVYRMFRLAPEVVEPLLESG
jgi:hypothetical protein